MNIDAFGRCRPGQLGTSLSTLLSLKHSLYADANWRTWCTGAAGHQKIVWCLSPTKNAWQNREILFLRKIFVLLSQCCDAHNITHIEAL